MEPLEKRSEAQRVALDQLGSGAAGKLARYSNSGKGLSSAASGRVLWRPATDSSDEEQVEEEVPVRNLQLQSRDYILNDEEEAMAVQQVAVISAAEVRALPPRGGESHPCRARVRGHAEGGSRPPRETGGRPPRLRVGRRWRSLPRHTQ
jgi:hypothetical protein